YNPSSTSPTVAASSTTASASPAVTLRSWVGILTVTLTPTDLNSVTGAPDVLYAAAGEPTVSSKDSTVGSTSRASNVPRTASRVLSPSPVIVSTTRSPGSMSPRSASLRRTATVTPPAVSVKTPVVSA